MKITFENFLCGIPVRDYITQDIPYQEQINEAGKMLKDADYVLIGAGAGMSTAAGAQYGGSFFEENFGEFQKKYGKGPYMQDIRQVFIRIRMKKAIGATGRSRHCSVAWNWM